MDQGLYLTCLREDPHFTAETTFVEGVAEEGDIGRAIFDEQNVDVRFPRNSRRRKASKLGLTLPTGLNVLDNFFGLFNDLPSGIKGLVGVRNRIPRALNFFPGLLSYLCMLKRRKARTSTVVLRGGVTESLISILPSHLTVNIIAGVQLDGKSIYC